MENKKYTVILAIPNMDKTTVNQMERLFFGYKEKGVIKSGFFDNDQWPVTDEYANYTLDFSISESNFQELGTFLNMSVKDFILYLKTYIVSQMGTLSLGTLQHIIYVTKSIASSSMAEISDVIAAQDDPYLDRVCEFCSLLPPEGREESLQQLSDYFDNAEDNACSHGEKRTLAAFESYFRFDDILKRFWVETTDESEKLFYFPIWLWWNVSAILPLRPREFVLTPRNCITKVGKEYKLTVRRNNIKGPSKTKSYKINEDYKSCQYTIPERIAKEIIWYQQVTDKYTENDIHTLFIADTHYSKWGKCRPYTSRYFTYVNLRTCMRYFYEQIVHDRYGYTIIFDRDSTVFHNEKEINYLLLGDTRHLALINLIMEGATPMVAMMLAGHDNPEMSAHYYSNITTLIECRTYRQYKKMLSGKQVYKISGPTTSLAAKDFTLLGDGSRCYSEKVREGNFSDCCKVSGPSGELGFCGECTYHRDEGKTFRDSSDLYANKIVTECVSLQEIVKKVRRGRGEPEEITQVLLRLRDEDYSYQRYLIETMGAKDAKE